MYFTTEAALPSASHQKFKVTCSFLTNLDQDVHSFDGIATSLSLSNLHFAEHFHSL